MHFPIRYSTLATDRIGYIFDAPNNSLLIHACNCQGNWSAGIAKAFKDRYPDAYTIYRNHCLENSSKSSILRGSSLLIKTTSKSGLIHYIRCLFTNDKYGAYKDSPEMILDSTKSSMTLLVSHILEIQDTINVSNIRICKINSVNFSVNWNDTLRVLRDITYEGPNILPIVVVYSIN